MAQTVKQEFVITVKERLKSGHVISGLLPYRFKLKMARELRMYDRHRVVLNAMPKEKMLEYYKKAQYGELVEIDITLVAKKTKFYHGEYYAHEYGEYLPGKVRRIEYTNGRVEYEVQCLDKAYNVMDGIWEEEDRYNDRYTNGCGDYFETYERTPWAKI